MSVPRQLNVDTAARDWLDERLQSIETHLDEDVLAVYGPVGFGLDHRIRNALVSLGSQRDGLLVILDTPGGTVEVVERIASVIRSLYKGVRFLIPDRAMSAGTVLVMSGDAILMDFFSCLGPIDPQVERDGRYVPALSYLAQFDGLVKKSEEGTLTTAELVLLKEPDLAELRFISTSNPGAPQSLRRSRRGSRRTSGRPLGQRVRGRGPTTTWGTIWSPPTRRGQPTT